MVVYTCHPSIRHLGHKNCKVEVSLCYIANARPSKAMYLDYLKPTKLDLLTIGSWIGWLNTCNKSIRKDLSLDPYQLHGKLGVEACACYPRDEEVEVPGISVLSQPSQN